MLAVALALVPALVPTISTRASPRTASPTMLEPPPKRVAVVGAGIGGLALARALQTLDTGVEDVAVFERRDELKPNIGGGIQINGGAAVLARLGLGEQMKASALPVRRILSRKSGGFELLDIDVESLVRGEPSLVDETGTPQAFSIMRDALQRMLADALPAGTVRPEALTLTLARALALTLALTLTLTKARSVQRVWRGKRARAANERQTMEACFPVRRPAGVRFKADGTLPLVLAAGHDYNSRTGDWLLYVEAAKHAHLVQKVT